jgi:hypothetical protein
MFPQDLKMWAKSAGRKFLEAQEKIKAFPQKIFLLARIGIMIVMLQL